MAFMLHDEGEEYLLQVAFSEEQSAPANFYIGLCDDTLVEADGLADILNELSGNGYARQTVASDDTDCVIAIDGDYYKCTFAEQTFTASGGNWDEVGPIDPARTLSDGDSADVETYIRVK